MRYGHFWWWGKVSIKQGVKVKMGYWQHSRRSLYWHYATCGDRSSIGRALDCGSSGCGFKPHRSPSISHFISPVVIFPIVMQLWQGYNSPWELCWLFVALVALVAVVTQVAGALLYQKWRQLGFFQVQVWSKGVYAEALSLHYLWKRTLGYTAI